MEKLTTLPHEKRVLQPLSRATWDRVLAAKEAGEHNWQTLERIVQAGIQAEAMKAGGHAA